MRSRARGAAALVLLASGLLFSNRVWAHEPAAFGEGGTFVFGAERLFGVNAWDTTVTVGGEDIEASGTNFDLLVSVPLTGVSFFPINPSGVARIAFDYFVMGAFSVGGAFGYFSTSGETTEGNTTEDLPSTSGFAFAPRVGYATMFSDLVGIWLRGGFVFFSATTELQSGFEQSVSAQNITLEALLLIVPVGHLAITVGPLVDIGIGGDVELVDDEGDTAGFDATYTSFGVMAGLFGYL